LLQLVLAELSLTIEVCSLQKTIFHRVCQSASLPEPAYTRPITGRKYPRRGLQSRRVGFQPAFVCLSVYPHDISKTDATRIKTWQKCSTMSAGDPLLLGSKGDRSKTTGTSHKYIIIGVCICALMSVVFFSLHMQSGIVC